MAKFIITSTTTVAELKEQFSNEVGATLRVYNGRSEAPEEATLVSLGAKEGELECRTSRTVGAFEEAFQSDLNLKVKVYTKDNWVKVLDGITLAKAAELPNGMTKAKMEEYLAYQREDSEEDNSNGDDNNSSTESIDAIFAETAMNNSRSIILRAHSFSNPVTTFEELKENLREACSRYDGESGVVMPLVLGVDKEGDLTLAYLCEKQEGRYCGIPFRIPTSNGIDECEDIIEDFDIEYAKKELETTEGVKKFYYCFIEAYPPLSPWDESEEENENLTYEEREEKSKESEVLFPAKLWYQNMEDEYFGVSSLLDDWIGDRCAVAVTDDGLDLRVWDRLYWDRE